jgi:hypothetical protein
MSEDISKRQNYGVNGSNRATIPLHPSQDISSVVDGPHHNIQPSLQVDTSTAYYYHEHAGNEGIGAPRFSQGYNQLSYPNSFATAGAPVTPYLPTSLSPVQLYTSDPLYAPINGNQPQLPSPYSASSLATSPNSVLKYPETALPPQSMYTQVKEPQNQSVGVNMQPYTPGTPQPLPLEVRVSHLSSPFAIAHCPKD